jgi:acetylornithine deacetylase/succinyl-diaminopimelate desuccinylase-like protein
MFRPILTWSVPSMIPNRRLISCLLAALFFSSIAESQERDARAVRAAARQWSEGREAAVLDEYRQLLAIPNVASDLPNIRRNAEFLMRMLRARGAEARLLEVGESPPAVYGELRAPGATRTVVLYAHYDGQPVDSAEWATPPFRPVLRDRAHFRGGREIPFPTAGQRTDPENRIYARSTSDDKASIMAMLAALDAMRANDIAPSVNLKFFFEGEEEAGSARLREILVKYKDLLAADAWVFGDGPVHQSGLQQVVFGVRGVTGLELTVYGPTRPLHSGHYGNWAPNPGALLANLVASMRDDEGRIRIAGFYDDVRPLAASERRAIAALPQVDSVLRSSLGLARTEADDAVLAERIMQPALNVRGLRVGGVREQGANVISSEAHASFDFRLVPAQTPERVRELVERHVRAQGYHIVSAAPDSTTRRAHPKIAMLTWETGYPASRASLDSPFAQALLAAVSAGTERPPLTVPTLGGSLPTYHFEQVLGVPMVVLPIANFDNNQHGANENLRLGNLWDGIELYAALMARIGREWTPRVVP